MTVLRLNSPSPPGGAHGEGRPGWQGHQPVPAGSGRPGGGPAGRRAGGGAGGGRLQPQPQLPQESQEVRQVCAQGAPGVRAGRSTPVSEGQGGLPLWQAADPPHGCFWESFRWGARNRAAIATKKLSGAWLLAPWVRRDRHRTPGPLGMHCLPRVLDNFTWFFNGRVTASYVSQPSALPWSDRRDLMNVTLANETVYMKGSPIVCK